MVSITELHDYIFAIFNFSIHVLIIILLEKKPILTLRTLVSCPLSLFYVQWYFCCIWDFLSGLVSVFFKYRFVFNSGTKSLAQSVTPFTACPKT